MRECVIVKTLRNRKVKESINFSDYDKALDYAIRKGYNGYDCLILRVVNGRWYKDRLYSSEPL